MLDLLPKDMHQLINYLVIGIANIALSLIASLLFVKYQDRERARDLKIAEVEKAKREEEEYIGYKFTRDARYNRDVLTEYWIRIGTRDVLKAALALELIIFPTIIYFLAVNVAITIQAIIYAIMLISIVGIIRLLLRHRQGIKRMNRIFERAYKQAEK